MDYLFLVLGLGLLLLSADFLVDSSVVIAQRAKISNFIIGLTIVGMGTSSPELLVSISSALTGSGDIALGNVVGSNIANILLILGVSAVILPFDIKQTTQRRDIPFSILATLILLLLANDKQFLGVQENMVSRLDGIIFLMLFIAYIACIVFDKSGRQQERKQEADEAKSKFAGVKTALLWAIAIASLAGLIYGGMLFLESAKNLARAWGMSEAVIAITIVAVGTSLPELITSIVASCKNNPQLALGNVLGSNVFNILFVLGLSATIKPLALFNINMVDYIAMLAASLMTYLVVFTFGKHRFDRIEGIIFLLCYVGYTVQLLLR